MLTAEQQFYLLMGPEGMSDRPMPYHDLDSLVQGAAMFMLRFMQQGYYKDTRMREQPLDWVARHLSVEPIDVKRTATQAYTAYVNDNLERIQSDGWVPLSYEEFLHSEEFDNLTDIDIDDPALLPKTSAGDADGWEYIGKVGVDSGQLMLCDPSYIDEYWIQGDERPKAKYFVDQVSGKTYYCGLHGTPPVEGCTDFGTFADPVAECDGKTPNRLIEEGRWKEYRKPPSKKFSYSGACEATLSNEGVGQLLNRYGLEMAVAFRSGLGDGVYNVFAKREEVPHWGERITEVRVVMITEADIAAEDDVAFIIHTNGREE